jgi:hypothetical protein
MLHTYVFFYFKGWFVNAEPIFISGVHTNTVVEPCNRIDS